MVQDYDAGGTFRPLRARTDFLDILNVSQFLLTLFGRRRR
jgi:hypothetical protein